MTVYEKYKNLNIDGLWIGLIYSDTEVDYFCTPKGSRVIGWEGCDGIHYCFIDGYGETVFAVNPESCVDMYVYPLAENFTDFLRLILACGSTTAIEQIVGWSKAQFESFIADENSHRFAEQIDILKQIEDTLFETDRKSL